jgi:hypothetical protein
VNERTLSRVSFLGAGLVTAAGALGGYAAQARAATSVQAWGLDPDGRGGLSPCACRACASCRSHAANKLFASAADADAGRAHLYCKCLVAPLVVLDETVYNALFVDGGARRSVDRRHQWVRAVLARHPSRQPAAISDGSVQAVLRRVFMRRKTNGTRTLYVDIESVEAVNATITLTRGRSTLAEKQVTGSTGRRRRKLEIPADVKAGPAHLRVTLRDSAGNTDVVTRGIEIPPAWQVRR